MKCPICSRDTDLRWRIAMPPHDEVHDEVDLTVPLMDVLEVCSEQCVRVAGEWLDLDALAKRRGVIP
jgi:hypothetical protein